MSEAEIRKMKKGPLESLARDLGLKNPDYYVAPELRKAVLDLWRRTQEREAVR